MESYSVLFPPGKRHINPTSTTMHDDPNTNNTSAAASKRPKPPQPPLFIPPCHIVFRFGKSGSIIKQLHQFTNSRIRVEHPIDCIDDRVNSVVSSPSITNRVKLSDLAPKDGEETNGGTINGVDGGVEWFDVSADQEGVLRVSERVAEVAVEVDTASGYGGVVSCRLLAWKNQGGMVIGKGGYGSKED